MQNSESLANQRDEMLRLIRPRAILELHVRAILGTPEQKNGGLPNVNSD
jgi:hypothetical protein